ncbi:MULTISPECIES: 16S rRNA (uracil(1498)-N(3))-methyltransferase [Salinicola]|uniref:16S rRNA (uracil(1498)-N(3))-methyltransferase n=1 Tax=Salinicola TaxID=404432 RepID=UPI0008DD20F0|nr:MULTISPECIES: 16S rRNA (uracil(1498)-N(3))-methyltransferase [Salinicola]MDF3918387.1 16S rRNA (uracil(1498)-N(3))-methyltransferase [Salinicola salarius]OHZ01899.1 16S rRNA (uracil(1498)-N(3))-methyltransferase [Salinicola sp. MIT1003]
MNLILLQPEDWANDTHACLRDPRRLHHLREVHRAAPGDCLTVGALDGLIGRGELLSLTDTAAQFRVTLDREPPAPLPVHLLLALPRPRMLARTLEHVSALGVKRVTLMHTRRVEKSYWQSPELKPEKIRQHLLLGLEQARDTRLPEIAFETRFKPFVEDRLPAMLADHRGLLAHPGLAQACPRGISDATLLAIGPEGGFVDYEVEKFLELGFEGIHLGERILRVETAVTALLSRLF